MKLSSRDAALVVPIVLTNSVAVSGQLLWGWEHLASGLPRELGIAVVVTFALAVESVGVYLAIEAHQSRMAGDASGFLLGAAYGVGLLAGALNYSHWITESSSAAVTFGVMSALSPWLWSIRSRSMHRAQLRERGLVDPRAVRFSLGRKLLYPVRTFKAYRAAVWMGEVDPSRAVALLDDAPSIPSTAPSLAVEDQAPVPASTPPTSPEAVAPERVGGDELAPRRTAKKVSPASATKSDPAEEERLLANLPGWVGTEPPKDWQRHIGGAKRTKFRRLDGAKKLRQSGAGGSATTGATGVPAGTATDTTGGTDSADESEREVARA